jgi:hypothetical protein
MTETEWLGSLDVMLMLEFLRGKTTARKLRLFVAACAWSLRPVFGDKVEAVAAMHENHADGKASDEDLIRFLLGDMFCRVFPDGVIPPIHKLQPVWNSARTAAREATDFTHPDMRDNTAEEKASICNLLRDIVGNPVRPPPPLPLAVLGWNDACVVKLAQGIYEERPQFRGTLDSGRLVVLADVLEEAGCVNPDILGHCREQGRVHVRGCWIIDLLLAKE